MSDRVRIPSDLNEEDVFFSLGPVKLSIRQLTVVGSTFVVWYCVAKFFLADLLGLNMIFAMIACSWVLVIGLAVAFAKVGNRPIDMWIGDKISFIMGARTFVMREDNVYGNLDANLEDDRDMQALLDYRNEHRN